MLKIGHRGACGHAPENTLLSMQKALDFGVDGIEFDIQLSKDGEPMVIHDDTLERTTNGKGAVSDYTYKELQKFDAGKGEKIPHLRDIFELVNKRCQLFIETKAENAEGAVAQLITEYVQKGWGYEQIEVISFNHPQLVRIRNLNPRIRTGATLIGIPITLAAIAEEAGCISINPGIQYVNEAIVSDAHRRGLKVYCWTANSPRHIAKAKHLKIDGIFSDYPERV